LKIKVYREFLGRPIVKAVSNRRVILIADFLSTYSFTGKSDAAPSFMLAGA